MRIRMLTVVELEVLSDHPLGDAMRQLDAFREATQPAAQWGITLYRAQRQDVAEITAGPEPVMTWRPIAKPAPCEARNGGRS